MTVADRFHTLLSQIAVGARELADYDSHRQSVQQAVGAAYAGSRCQVMGSHARGSAISGTSDLDLLAALPIGALRRSAGSRELVSSNTVLTTLRDRLNARFHATSIRRDGQAVVVGFGDGARDIDVVPAAFAQMLYVPALDAKRPTYWIPDGTGSWLLTAPSAHNDYIARADRSAGGKLKYTAQLLRHWRRSRAQKIPMLTFHAELVLAHGRTCNGMRGYGHLLADSFDLLATRRGAALQDPLGISGYVPIASTSAKRDQVATSLAHAAEHSAKALAFESVGRFTQAYEQWSIVFNGQFPSR